MQRKKIIKRKRRLLATILIILLFCAAAAAYLYFFKRPEASSELLNRWPADGSGMIEPLEVIALGKGQDIYTHPARKYCSQKDSIRFAAVA